MSTQNPFSAPEADLEVNHGLMAQYGGLTRPGYFGCILLMMAASIVLTFVAPNIMVESSLLLNLVFLVIGVALAYQRFKNIGDNPWLSLLSLVPIVNVVIGIRCLAYPTGYAETKQLDTAAKIIIAVCVGFIILVGFGLWIAFQSLGELP